MGSATARHVLISKAHDYTSTAPPSKPTLSSLKQQKQQPVVEKVFAMSQGDGEESYSKNSGYQATVNKISRSVLEEGLEKLTLSFERAPVVVADLGCSSGRNSIVNVGLIVDKLRRCLTQDVHFQVFFNDLPSNDFNNLFRLLSNDRSAADMYLAAGVPGSFFGRLFPSSSVHVFHSSLSVHWMSKVPDAVQDAYSPSYNRGNPWTTNASLAVARAYQQQAALDMNNFLVARAEELVSGGLLFFSFVGRSTVEANTPTNDLMTTFFMDLVQIWRDLVAEGLLTEQQLDTFNFPCYVRTVEEIREDLKSCDSLFDVLTAKIHRIEVSANEVFATSGATVISSKMKSMLKSIVNSLLEAHVGGKASEVIWTRYERLVDERIRMNPENLLIRNAICFVSLIRK